MDFKKLKQLDWSSFVAFLCAGVGQGIAWYFLRVDANDYSKFNQLLFEHRIIVAILGTVLGYSIGDYFFTERRITKKLWIDLEEFVKKNGLTKEAGDMMEFIRKRESVYPERIKNVLWITFYVVAFTALAGWVPFIISFLFSILKIDLKIF